MTSSSTSPIGTAPLRRAGVGLVLGVLVLTGCADEATDQPEEVVTVAPTTEPTEPTEPTGTAEPGTPTPQSPEPAPTAPTEQDPGNMDEPTSEQPPGLLTETDSGERVTLGTGEEVPLRLDNAWVWDEPQVEGAAVNLTRVDYLVDPGFTEWIVVAQAPGEASLTVTGEPACGDDAVCPPAEVTLTFDVEG